MELVLVYAAVFIAGLEAHFGKWRDSAALGFRELESGCHPKEIIEEFSEHLLHHAEGQGPRTTGGSASTLVDPYAIYQHLMDYWAATMQDATCRTVCSSITSGSTG